MVHKNLDIHEISEVKCYKEQANKNTAAAARQNATIGKRIPICLNCT